MRSIKTVIRENGLSLDFYSRRMCPDSPWSCTGRIRGIIYVLGGESQRDAVNNWLEIRNLFDPSASASRSSSITSQE